MTAKKYNININVSVFDTTDTIQEKVNHDKDTRSIEEIIASWDNSPALALADRPVLEKTQPRYEPLSENTVDTSEIVKQNQAIDNSYVSPEVLAEDFSSNNKILLEKTEPKTNKGLFAGVLAGVVTAAASAAFDLTSLQEDDHSVFAGLRAVARGVEVGKCVHDILD